jgi:multiple sugar transport system permease protein
MQKADTLTSIKRTRSRGFFANRQNVGLLFALPAVLFSVVFFVIPLIMTVFMSFHDWPLLGEHHFIGLDNYVKLAADGQFWNSLWFTTRYTVVITPIIFILAFILAALVNLPLRFIGFFRTAFFLPVVIGLGTSSLLWVWLLNDRVGAIDGILVNLKLIPRSIVWLGEPNSAMTWIIISVVWKTVGFTMVLLLTGMQAIPEELYQQAMVDGANAWAKLRYITLPLLRRTFALAMILSVIGSYLGFDQFYIMTRGGPQNSTISVVYWIFNNSFTYFRLGYGAALSIVLLVILVILSVIQLRLLRDETQY